MFGMSGMELIVIAVVALVAIGPKDLPKALRMAGKFVAQMRRMAGDFQAQFNEAVREADLEELRKNASDINDAVAPFKSGFNPLKGANEQLQKAIGDVALPLPAAVEPIEQTPPEPAKPADPETPAPRAKPAAKAAKAKAASPKTTSGRQKAVAKTEKAPAKAAPRARKSRNTDESA